MSIKMEKAEFEDLVQKALKDLPSYFSEKLENVAVVVEDNPSMDQRRKLKLPENIFLFGLYEGVPKVKRGEGYVMVPPDKITIFKEPIEKFCQTNEEIITLVKDTVLHEIGHHFGLSEEDLKKHK